MNIFKKQRGPAVHLLMIGLALAALAASAWWYTNSREAAPGLPEVQVPAALTDGSASDVPTDPEACNRAGGTWNECASACPPDAEACILMCVPRCEGLAEAKKINP